MIELQDVSKSFGGRTLFKKVNLRIGPQDRVALVGPNGAGKTTLFKIMLGEISPDEGKVERMKGLRIGYLPQEVYLGAGRSQAENRPMGAGRTLLEDCVYRARGAGPLVEERARIISQIEQGDYDESLLEALSKVEDRLQAIRYDSLQAEAEAALLGLGFSREDLMRPVSTLSGGLAMRAELARLLLDEPDILMLDEPLNHLDLEGILWFEEYLQNFKGALVLVAHDREFINRTCNRVVEVSERGAIDYGGNPNVPVYDRYVQEREKAIELAWKRYYEQQARIREIEEFIQRNRVRKDRAQVVQSRIRMLEKMERLEPPAPIHKVHFSFPKPPRAPDLVLSLEGVGHRYGERFVFRGLELRVHRGERIALVGLNGAGKSTLLKIAAGVLSPTEGLRRLGEGVEVGFFAQDQYEILRPEWTVLQHMMEVADPDVNVRSILGAFLFSDDDMEKRVSVLSGGEKARLMLARLLVRPRGLLVMDEPTNHLDIASREVLEKALLEYQGTLLFTSHDRRFMDTIATAVLELRDGRLTRFEGNYSYYRQKVEEGLQTHSEQRPRPLKEGPSKRDLEKARKREEAERRNRLYRMLKPLRERVARYEAEISALETELREVERELVNPDLYKDFEKARKLGEKARELRKRLDALYEEWARACEDLEGVESTI